MYILYGVILIASGIFVASFGGALFRFALAAIGFGVGAMVAWWLTASQPDTMRILISLGIGGIAAVVLFMLVRVGIYIAGGVLGLVLAFLVVAFLGTKNPVVNGILLVAGTGVSGYFGPRLGNLIIALATGAAGAFQIVYGLALVFGERMAPSTLPSELLGGPLAISVFLIIAAISAISQSRPRVAVLGRGR